MNKVQMFFSIMIFFSLAACSKGQEGSEIVTSPSEGELLYKNNCKVCHSQGINGAPILGNSAMWGPRITQGKGELLEHAINGYGLMPAKGGRTELSDNEVSLVIDYMLSELN